MFVNCLVKQSTICFVVFAILLLNVMDLLSMVEVLYWIDHVWFSKECVCCACDPIERLDAPSMCFCMSEVISSFRSLRAGSLVFESWITGVCSPYVVYLCDFAYYVFG